MTGERLWEGRSLAARVRAAVAERAAGFRRRFGRPPGLAAVLVGDDPASRLYVGNKARACREAGIYSEVHHLPARTSQAELVALVRRLNTRPDLDGILVQWPVPGGIDYEAVLAEVDPVRDVDGFHPVNTGALWRGRPRLVPCTPLGILLLLRAYGVAPAGRRAVVVGRSPIVGRPMAGLLLLADATVTVCHSRTPDLARTTREAEIVVVAAGRPGLIGAEHIAPGAAVVDVGINRVDGRVTGDVRTAEVAQVAAGVTPVPGGVGPMTVAMLLANTVEAAWARAEERWPDSLSAWLPLGEAKA
ncbi:5,10-methylenetetrahydrofolate dehydrogenase (NADP+); methenyltetrahydrofolate cyclohydrolase [Thermaerobacter marianensis DSM 12885]|uniref:Bifunctional protein FolD n=1 Tax=Thermaerobacter marianensis (strain ATCC 700841 / DSM 12885 / JCM 10246 / 7p75a) TaxID=644966 RepID=E6SKS7_THEM7|nr:bifunctional methylenetetrahydrofolate dehydrogenase/methenyltetrahydrofolate cyclohydrolase FolD [Thermaerobacter marianensis]ADU51285.1 5,10-methylenetetrahydrofolate dehydrogenase (NADP+); methenyltetrahydrofolate cyclohydrolase [Thermaerobacter marianensis DSM 12885]